ncbi:N-acetyltransferase GCN5 [Hydrogenophaga taeniospiralis CCUG 15921]|uniref:N-acetyltransferase GCN5 n=1 Tax=Hydrogenophaga taeniospiralis CCUG 15921 TaxID=1281780 RepID=A0A9X4SAJ1_9BURK|nr:GNAT family N-acetyltransferase [Hydrogenophaga taeniospiralis]MDG5976414.1 N-acetyltransferase GCN5 [Hydrogenophaga taeniospiralis CCUG 15921]
MSDTLNLSTEDVEAIERATLKAVAPERVDAIDGWLLPMDSGTVGRAHSAVPLHHGAHDPSLIDEVAQRYKDAGLRPVLRLPDVPAFDAWWPALAARGFRREQPTLTQTGALEGLLCLAPDTEGVSLEPRPDAAWMAMFLGEGLDPVDGASRSRALSRAEGTLFGSLREGGQTVACGAACYAEGWLSMHGLRTVASQRGRGLAGRLIRAMALEAQRRGIARVFLQVDGANAPALALYRRAGMTTAWSYAYWRLPATATTAAG